MAKRMILAAACLALSFQTSAGQEDVAPPVAGRPEDFSNIVGMYRVAASAEPMELRVEDPLKLVVRIAGEGPPDFQPQRQKLRLFPAGMSDDFFIEPVPDKDRRLDKEKTWEFVYRLRPKHDAVKSVPGLKLVYYHPGRRKFQSSYSSAIELKVTPRSIIEPPSDVVKAVSAPKSFVELAPAAEVLGQSGSWRLSEPMILLLLLLAPPMLACAWRWRDQRDNRNGQHLAQLLRSQAAQRALHLLQMQNVRGEQVFSIVNDFLHQRLDLAMAEPGPLEIERVLRRAGVSKPVRNRVESFLETCDAARFGSDSYANGQLAKEAVQLIQALEAEPCLR